MPDDDAHRVDLGVVHRERLRRCDVSVAVALEQRQQAWFVVLDIDQRAGVGFRRQCFIAWPYSRVMRQDLSAVLADLRALEAAASGVGLRDTRGRFGRWFDLMTGRGYLGSYEFRSPLDWSPQVSIRADVCRDAGSMACSLTETRRSHGLSMGIIPHAAVAAVRRSLERLQSA